MPIVYSKETQSWELKDASTEEKEALTQIAIDVITDFFGEEMAKKIVDKVKIVPVNQEIDLEEIDPEDMGTA